MSRKSGWLLVVTLPAVLMWVLLIFGTNSFGAGEKLVIGTMFTVLWTPLMYLRVRNW